MDDSWRSFILLALKLIILSLFFAPFFGRAMALEELFDIYSSPQGLLMGNAVTADAQGHSSNYYNPAGLAKASKREWEIIPVAFETLGSIQGLSSAIAATSFGLHQVAREMQRHPDRYYYNRFNFMPAVSRRGFALTLLGSFENAGRSDGTQYNTVATVDWGTSVGYGVNLAGNLLKLGVSAKAILRNQLNGTFDHTSIETENSMKEKMSEGLGAGADFGLLFTFPNKYLPTFGLTWRDMFDTRFSAASRTLNSFAEGRPESIKQSVNAAFSLHPSFSRAWRGTLAVEFKHFERTDLSFGKRFHLGLEVSNSRNLYLWAGLNQLCWTLGMGLRTKGGDLELGSYGVDIGQGNTREESRRIALRYTIGF